MQSCSVTFSLMFSPDEIHIFCLDKNEGGSETDCPTRTHLGRIGGAGRRKRGSLLCAKHRSQCALHKGRIRGLGQKFGGGADLSEEGLEATRLLMPSHEFFCDPARPPPVLRGMVSYQCSDSDCWRPPTGISVHDTRFEPRCKSLAHKSSLAYW